MNANSISKGRASARRGLQPQKAAKPKAAASGSRPRRPPRAARAQLGSISSMVNPILPAAAPMQSSGQRHQTTVCARREMVLQVIGNTGFGITAYPINAGLAQMFAWESSEARRFEKYRFRRLAFEYVNAIGPADPSNSGGNIAMAVDYDVLDDTPAALQNLMQNETAKLFSPYDKVRMELSPADLQRRGWLYTRVAGVPSGADAKTYDLGNLYVACVGNGSAFGLGNLFVDYEVELDVPQEVPLVCQKITGTTGLTASVLFGTDAASSSGSVSAFSINAAGSTLTCNVAGEYLFLMRGVGTTFVLSLGGSAPGLVSVSSAWNSAATELFADANNDQTKAYYCFVARVAVGDTLAPTINSAATFTSVAWRITQYKYAVA